MLCEVTCGDRSCAPRGKICEFLPISSREGHTASGMLRQSNGPRDEVSGDSGLDKSDDIKVVGFSTAAKQLYKARGPQLHTPIHRGELSEVDLLAWKRGIEKYFETY